MTAPDPTAGERPVHGRGDGWATACGQDRANVRLWTDDPGKVTCRACLPASPPAVAASTGTSEDVEALLDRVDWMDLWWQMTGDDWPVPDSFPREFAKVVVARLGLAAREVPRG